MGFFGYLRQMLEGRSEIEASPWILDSLEKTLLMWPVPGSIAGQAEKDGLFTSRKKAVKNAAIASAAADASFAHLRRLFRYGFRLSTGRDGLRLNQFFADGKIFRPEGYSRKSRALITELSQFATEPNVLRVGQCRIAPAKPVLKALGFENFNSADSFALQFAGLCGERWIFIDSRPELFRREMVAAISVKLVELEAALDEKIAYGLDPGVSEYGPSL